MKRGDCTSRPDWQTQVELDGVVYHKTEGANGTFSYWKENAYYEVTTAQTELLAKACTMLTEMFIAAGDYIIANSLFDKMGIPHWAVPALVASWQDDDPNHYWPSVYGRFDLWWDGVNTPKLFEYNADTPTGFPESTAAQWNWLLLNPAGDGFGQWNDTYELLSGDPDKGWESAWRTQIGRFESRTGRKVGTIHFAYSTEDDSGEDLLNLTAIASTAEKAGYKVKILAMEDIELRTRVADEPLRTPGIAAAGTHAIPLSALADGPDAYTTTGYFFDQDGEHIDVLFKLYPWEWMIHQRFGKVALWNLMQPDGTLFIEPPYKGLLWSNKAILAILWEIYKNDPVRSQLLLPCYFKGEEPPGFIKNSVQKPFFSREGANVIIRKDGEIIVAKGGNYGEEGHIVQLFQPLPIFKGVYGEYRPVTCVWMVQQEPAGLCFRETEVTSDDPGLVTDNLCGFVPHRVNVNA